MGNKDRKIKRSRIYAWDVAVQC